MPDNPTQRYAAFRKRQTHAQTAAFRFASKLPFELDRFQEEAIEALEADDNVLVAAPTGSGKTVVADFAVFLAQEHNVKAFYTTPIKALSNQKYHDLVEVFGEDHVGLLTGDTSINAEADIVVMTTEVLRNMLYEHSTTLQALRYVVLDEVHYLSDRFRGPVWEEVIIHLPPSVRVIGLSATVSNVEDFSDWLQSVRGHTKLVITENRPVPLEQHVIVQSDDHTPPELIDLYRRNANADNHQPKLNPQLIERLDQLDRQAARTHGKAQERKHSSRHERNAHRRNQSEHFANSRHVPRRWAVVDELDYEDLLPGIYFIFSRNGCDQAVEQCMNAGLELTSADEAQRIRGIVDEMVEGQLSRDDLKTLRFSSFRFALEEGFAAHHAGMVSLFRQIVERLFEAGLVKMVFATETLALGINMPARCVVVEKLEKFNGIGHVSLTPGEFTQLKGRAGRRGIDSIGHAVVVDHRDFVPATAAALASKRVYPLHSSFRPTFNMAVNLLNSSDYKTARMTLDHSFAQWEANESAWQLESRMDTLAQALHGYEDAFACDHGDFAEFMEIRMRLSDAQKHERQELKHKRFRSEKSRSRAFRELDQRIAELKDQERHHPCRECPDLTTHLKWGHRWAREKKELERVRDRYESRTGSVARQFDHICEILNNLGYITPEYADAVSPLTPAHHDKVKELLVPGRFSNSADFVDDAHTMVNYTLTPRGQMLRRIYSEQDLVLAQMIVDHDLLGLSAPELAAVVSSLVYEARRGEGGGDGNFPGGPEGNVAIAVQASLGSRAHVSMLCEDYGLEPVKELDFGMSQIIYEWAKGETLSYVLRNTELTGGDFVRNTKRLADLLTQIAQVGRFFKDASSLSKVAEQAVHDVNRGIVAYSGVD
ncbi:DEAD/DEAH box helicase [Bifidobacterium aquikefiri]|uniref:DEAD/DEAH box helicase n=1 Tax=Bifidobacterium aquikefiri TaxID=1653207 RepID=UPI0039EA471A